MPTAREADNARQYRDAMMIARMKERPPDNFLNYIIRTLLSGQNPMAGVGNILPDMSNQQGLPQSVLDAPVPKRNPYGE
jgi:hypothetical protein